jgi:hypothetical protein
MSRARNIKPGFFRNDLLAECDPLARILFAGLWCIADREGRLEDRPKRIKAECLPYDDCDPDELLSQLASRGFITRYVVDSAQFISINEFGKHQNPHVKEAASAIPAPCKHGASPVQATEVPEQAGLIPDSPSLIPDPSQERERQSAADAAASPEAPAAEQPKPRAKRESKPAITLRTFRADGGLLVKAGEDPLLDYIDRIGLPEEFLRVAAHAFDQRFLATDQKQRDWPAHFRNAVQSNWFRLWWDDGGTWRLTTQGKQAERELQALAEKQRGAA